MMVLTKETDFYKIHSLYLQDIQNKTQQKYHRTWLTD